MYFSYPKSCNFSSLLDTASFNEFLKEANLFFIFSSPTASIDVASIPAFLAPFIATVATGIPRRHLNY